MYKTRAMLLMDIDELQKVVSELYEKVSELENQVLESKIHKSLAKESQDKITFEKWAIEKHLKRVTEEADFYKKLLLHKNEHGISNGGGLEDF